MNEVDNALKDAKVSKRKLVFDGSQPSSSLSVSGEIKKDSEIAKESAELEEYEASSHLVEVESKLPEVEVEKDEIEMKKVGDVTSSPSKVLHELQEVMIIN